MIEYVLTYLATLFSLFLEYQILMEYYKGVFLIYLRELSMGWNLTSNVPEKTSWSIFWGYWGLKGGRDPRDQPFLSEQFKDSRWQLNCAGEFF